MLSAAAIRAPCPVAVRPLAARPRAASSRLVCMAAKLRLEPADASLPALDLAPAAEFTLGAVDTDLIIDVATVSSKHAKVTVGEEGAVTIVDLGSTNGTQVDGAALAPNEPAPLAVGAEVVLGDAQATFRLVEVAEEAA